VGEWLLFAVGMALVERAYWGPDKFESRESRRNGHYQPGHPRKFPKQFEIA
jgi:hypothetical protein